MNDASAYSLLLIPASFVYVIGSLIVDGRKLGKKTNPPLSLDANKGVWAGRESIFDVTRHGRGALYYIPMLFCPFGLGISALVLFEGEALIVPLIIGALSIFGMKKVVDWGKSPEWLGDDWILEAFDDEKSGVLLSHDKAGALNWAVYLDEVARVESGTTVEWEKMRKYRGASASIPDAEYQTFIFTNDGRRLVVHTANAAREDCGQLAYSIRSYVETQRGNAAPSPSSSATSSPAADGFDL